MDAREIFDAPKCPFKFVPKVFGCSCDIKHPNIMGYSNSIC